LSTPELITRIKDEKLHYRKLTFNHTVSPVEDPQVLKETRRNIARLKTEFRRRELSEVEGKEQKPAPVAAEVPNEKKKKVAAPKVVEDKKTPPSGKADKEEKKEKKEKDEKKEKKK